MNGLLPILAFVAGVLICEWRKKHHFVFPGIHSKRAILILEVIVLFVVGLIGLEDKKSDLEVLVLALEALEKLGLSDFKLEIGNIGFFEGVFETLNISKESKEIIAQYIEDKNLKNLEDYLDEIDIKDEYKEFFNKLPWLFGDRSILEEAKVLAFNEELKANLEYLENLYSELDILGYGNKVTFDLGMVPRLNYYTGIIFRGYGEGVGNTVLRGGRYDNLITIGEEYIPAIGFSLDINSVIENVKISEKINTIDKSCKIYYSSKYRIEAIRKSEKLRQEGKIVELIPDDSVNEIKVLL